jgi:thiol-disulfide isomerase/thioredoxin
MVTERSGARFYSEDKMKVFAFLILCFVPVAFADDFKAIDGKEYKNVTVTRVEPDGLVLKSKSGISKVYFIELPPDVQKRFQYNPANAAAYSAEQAASQAAYQMQQAEQRQKVAEERNRYWTGEEPTKTPQNSLLARAASLAQHGQQVEVISHGAQVDINQHLALGNVTVVDFYADWCGPCRQLSPSLEQMARTDPEIALRKIDIGNGKTAVARQYNIGSIPQVNIYNRDGRLVGTVVGANIDKVRSYVAQAKSGS